MTKAVTVTLAVFIALLLIWSYVSGKDIPFSEQWPLYEALRTTASIIFAVVGAWLAIIYPDRLKFAFRSKPEGEESNRSNSSMGKLLSPAIHSTAILCVVLLVGIIAPLISTLPLPDDWRLILRGVSYVLLTSLTLWQLGTIVLTLIPADQIKHVTDKEDLKNETLSGYFKQAQRIEKD